MYERKRKILLSALFFLIYYFAAFMRKQSGFTLIELMVVMAIIAILATAGLSAYGGYIKKARDSNRIEDLRAIEAVVLASLGINGSAPDLDTLIDTLTDMNNGTLLEAPLSDKNVCMNDGFSPTVSCKYEYYPCDNFIGYTIKTRFENDGNARSLYNDFDSFGAPTGYYKIGKCDNEQLGEGGVIESP